MQCPRLVGKCCEIAVGQCVDAKSWKIFQLLKTQPSIAGRSRLTTQSEQPLGTDSKANFIGGFTILGVIPSGREDFCNQKRYPIGPQTV